ncbi:MAG: propionate CoA-transferase [Oscillospiraceae bacterium]|nr:propionate CoA-transferase [Oscillospiraceae bacterium]
MFKILSAKEAISLIKDGDTIAINSFIAWSNPEALHDALYERIVETKTPKGLNIFCAAGFGAWDENRLGDRYMRLGAVKEVIAGHYGGMPGAVKAALAGEIEAYNLPLGVLSQTVRAAAAGKDWMLSEIGIGIFCDPRVDTYALNDISKRELVKVVEVEGKEYLLYYTPKPDIAFIKGTTVDPNGNISFEKEYLIVDALAVAQATKRNGGTVIVEVERVSHEFSRPRNVIVPGILVDVVVVCDNSYEHNSYNPALSGDVHVPATQMDYYINKLSGDNNFKKPTGSKNRDIVADIIGNRAAKELRPGHTVNLGIGIPENVGVHASKQGLLKDIYITVEAGGIGGLPAPGLAFGATIGADMISEMSTQFDFYEGGGLDICFLGGLEVDMYGNVNSHKMDGYYAGIGGFANITHATKNIVFCLTFTTKGLEITSKDGKVAINREGSIRKFKREVSAVSFSGKHAILRGQRVIYVTERCVFELTENGLKLIEVYDGIDEKSQIRDMLDFEV